MPDPTLRILLGDTHLESRALLEAICREQGWALTAVESSFQIMRLLRDGSDVSLVMVDPTLPGLGISGRDVARMIKTTAQFRPVHVMFVLHANVSAPRGIPVDGSIEIDGAAPARVLAAMREAIGGGTPGPRPEEAQRIEEAPPVAATPAAPAAAAVVPAPGAPLPGAPREQILAADAVAPAPGSAPSLAARPVDAHVPAPSAPPPWAEPLTQFREDLLAEVRRTLEAVLTTFAQTEGRALAEEAVHRAAATEARDLAKQVAASARETIGDTVARVERLEYALAAMRSAIEAARQAAEEARASNAQRIEAAGTREGAEAAIRQYLAEEGRTAVEHIVAALAREVVPPLAERLVQQQLDRLPSPTARVDEILPRIQGEILAEARRAADRVTRQQVEAMVDTIRQSIITTANDAARSLAREIIPTVVERLINDEIARLRKEHGLG